MDVLSAIALFFVRFFPIKTICWQSGDPFGTLLNNDWANFLAVESQAPAAALFGLHPPLGRRLLWSVAGSVDGVSGTCRCAQVCSRRAEEDKLQFEAPDFLKRLPKINLFFLNRTKRHYRNSRWVTCSWCPHCSLHWMRANAWGHLRATVLTIPKSSWRRGTGRSCSVRTRCVWGGPCASVPSLLRVRWWPPLRFCVAGRTSKFYSLWACHCCVHFVILTFLCGL